MLHSGTDFGLFFAVASSACGLCWNYCGILSHSPADINWNYCGLLLFIHYYFRFGSLLNPPPPADVPKFLRIYCGLSWLQNQSFSFFSSFRRRLRISRFFHGIPQNPLMVLRDSGSYSSFSYSVLHSAAACGYPKVSTDFLRVQMADIADFRNNTAESPPPLPPAYITSIPVDYRWISYFMVVKPLRRRLRILRKPCELLSILWQRSCFIFLQTDSAAACVHCGVPASVLDFLSWAPVNQLRLLLRILRKPC